MSKPYSIGTGPKTSLRRASPTYQQPDPNNPIRDLKIVPGFEQNQAPQGSVPLPNLPQAPVVKPFRVG